MNIFIVLFATFGVISCYYLPDQSDYDSNHLKIVQKCEIKNQISDAEKQIWWDWKIPAKHNRCQMACIMSGFNWINKKGNPKLKSIKKSYEAVGHGDSAPDQEFIKKNCGRKLPAHPCDKAIVLYSCFLVRSANLQHFYDAFDGKPNNRRI